MNRKIKLAFAAFLGFSTACSTVKNAPVKGEESADSLITTGEPQIIAMYGVRIPKGKKISPLQSDSDDRSSRNQGPTNDYDSSRGSGEGPMERD